MDKVVWVHIDLCGQVLDATWIYKRLLENYLFDAL